MLDSLRRDVKSDPLFFLLGSAFLLSVTKADCICSPSAHTTGLKFISIFLLIFFFFLPFRILGSLFQKIVEEEKSPSPAKHLHTGAEGWFIFLTKQMLHFWPFPVPILQAGMCRLQELAHTWAEGLPSPAGLCLSLLSKLGKNPSSSSSHLVKARVRIVGTRGRPCRFWGRWISSVLPQKQPWALSKFSIWQQQRSLLGCSSPSRVSLGTHRCWHGTGESVPASWGYPSLFLGIQPSWPSSTWILGPSSAQGICRCKAGGGYSTPAIAGAQGNCCQKLGNWKLEKDFRQEHVHRRQLIAVSRCKSIDLV